MSKKRHAQQQRARLRRHQDEQRRAKKAALHEAAPELPSPAPPEASARPESQGERGQGASDPQTQASSAIPPQPFTRSQLQDIRTGLKNGASPEAIANALAFNPLLLAAIPNTVGTMVIDKDLTPRDRIAAAKTFAVFVAQRMEQEKRDLKIPDRHVHTHEHTGTVTVEERREFWIHLGEALRDAPEQRERVAALLRAHIEAERDGEASKEAHEQPA